MLLGTLKAEPENYNYFANGMNGDEDLGQDITMKGQKFHYGQKPPVAPVVVQAPVVAQVATGCNEGETLDTYGNCRWEPTNVQLDDDKAANVNKIGAEKVSVL